MAKCNTVPAKVQTRPFDRFLAKTLEPIELQDPLAEAIQTLAAVLLPMDECGRQFVGTTLGLLAKNPDSIKLAETIPRLINIYRADAGRRAA